MSALATALAIIFLAGLSSCNHRDESRSGFQSDKWFRVAFKQNLPPYTGEVEGTGDTEESFNCYFRFMGEAERVIPFLVKSGFKESDLQEGEVEFDLPLGMRKHFNPDWDPHVGECSRLYTKEFDDTSVTEVLIESKSGRIYVHSRGDSNPGQSKPLPLVFRQHPENTQSAGGE